MDKQSPNTKNQSSAELNALKNLRISLESVNQLLLNIKRDTETISQNYNKIEQINKNWEIFFKGKTDN